MLDINSPAVESTPDVNEPEVSSAPDVVASTVSPITEEKLTKLLGDMEKRLGQSAKDTARATVNKALGISTKQAVPPPAPVPQSTSVVAPVVPVEQPALQSTADPILQKTFALLQQDGVPVQDSVDPVVLEAYRTQVEYGVHLTAQDPEFKLINNRTVTTYLMTVAQAAEAKKARMIEEGTYQEDTVTSAPILTPGIISGSVPSKLPHAGKSGPETLEMFFKGK